MWNELAIAGMFALYFCLVTSYCVYKELQAKRRHRLEWSRENGPSPRQLEEGTPDAGSGECDATKATGDGEARETPDMSARALHESSWSTGQWADDANNRAGTEADVEAGRPKGLIPLKLGQPGQKGSRLASSNNHRGTEMDPTDGDLGLAKEN